MRILLAVMLLLLVVATLMVQPASADEDKPGGLYIDYDVITKSWEDHDFETKTYRLVKHNTNLSLHSEDGWLEEVEEPIINWTFSETESTVVYNNLTVNHTFLAGEFMTNTYQVSASIFLTLESFEKDKPYYVVEREIVFNIKSSQRLRAEEILAFLPLFHGLLVLFLGIASILLFLIGSRMTKQVFMIFLFTTFSFVLYAIPGFLITFIEILLGLG